MESETIDGEFTSLFTVKRTPSGISIDKLDPDGVVSQCMEPDEHVSYGTAVLTDDETDGANMLAIRLLFESTSVLPDKAQYVAFRSQILDHITEDAFEITGMAIANFLANLHRIEAAGQQHNPGRN